MEGMKQRTPFNMITNVLSDKQQFITSHTRVPIKLEMSFGTKNVVIIRQNLRAKFMRANNNRLCRN